MNSFITKQKKEFIFFLIESEECGLQNLEDEYSDFSLMKRFAGVNSVDTKVKHYKYIKSNAIPSLEEMKKSLPEHLIEEIEILETRLKKELENLLAEDDVKDSLGKPGVKPIPFNIADSILDLCEEASGDSEKIEEFRRFLFEDIYNWAKAKGLQITITLPMVPSTKQENTEWFRKLKNKLNIRISKSKQERHKDVLKWIEDNPEESKHNWEKIQKQLKAYLNK